MKKVIMILFLTFGITTAFAKCAMSGMDFYPKQKEISLNSMFIIEGYYSNQKTINSFCDRTVYLESKNGELIELNIQEILKGQMGLTQAIFKPSKELKPNTTYFLKYSDQTEAEGLEMIQYNSKESKKEKIYWKTTDEKSSPTLNSDLEVKFKKTEVIQFGCGPSANAIFNVKNKSQLDTWHKTEVVDINTNDKAVYYLKESDGKINVGHGMCSGAFTFNKGNKYKVRFSPMNNDGKQLKTTDWTEFNSPFKSE